jgi:membrane protein
MTQERAMPWHLVAARVVRVLVQRVLAHRTPLVAAGCAFYATLALFPALAMLVSVYGLVFDIRTVEPQLATLHAFLPPDAYGLIERELCLLVSHRISSLSLGVAISAGFTVWSATTGTSSLMTALNFAYDTAERRSTAWVLATAAGLTLLAVVGAVLGLALMVALPEVLRLVVIVGDTRTLIHGASLTLTAVFVAVVLGVLYRFGPSYRPSGRRWILPGALAATGGWMAATALFSTYVGQAARFDATYGPLAAVAGIMLWFWVSAFAALAGAELNATLERELTVSVRSAGSRDPHPSAAASAPPGS